jgi:CHAD domain-containing protein
MGKIASYYHSQIRKLETNFFNAAQHNDEIALHNVRLAFKRIKAIYRFTRSLMAENDTFGNQISLFNNIYKHTGSMREYQVDRKIITSITGSHENSLGDLLAYFAQKENDALQAMLEQLKKVNIAQLSLWSHDVFEALSNISDRQYYENYTRFILLKTKNIERMVLYSKDQERFHSIRKHIKDVFFLTMLFKKHYPKKMIFNNAVLKNLEVEIGDWHDCDILRQHTLQFFRIKHITNYRSKNSRYYQFFDDLENRIAGLAAGMEKKIMQANAHLMVINGLNQLETI